MTLTSSIPVLRVSDYDRARGFWRDVLGFTVVEEADDPITGFGIYERDRAKVFLTAWDGPDAADTKWRAYFHTNDLTGIAARLDAAGWAFDGPSRTQYGMNEIEAVDPDGNVICFGQGAN